jgi:hypothetical protein
MQSRQSFVGTYQISISKCSSTTCFAEIRQMLTEIQLLLPTSQVRYSGVMTTASVSDSMASDWLGN